MITKMTTRNSLGVYGESLSRKPNEFIIKSVYEDEATDYSDGIRSEQNYQNLLNLGIFIWYQISETRIVTVKAHDAELNQIVLPVNKKY